MIDMFSCYSFLVWHRKIYWGWANLQMKGFIFPLVVDIIVSINFNGSFRAGLRENGWLIVQCWFWPWNPGAGNAAHVQLRYHEENRSRLEAFTFFSIKPFLKERKWKLGVHKNNFMWPLKRLRIILKNTTNISSWVMGMRAVVNVHQQRGVQFLHLVTNTSPYPKGQLGQ